MPKLLHPDILTLVKDQAAPLLKWLTGSMADLPMCGQIRECLQQTTSGHQSYPTIVPSRRGSKVCCVIVG